MQNDKFENVVAVRIRAKINYDRCGNQCKKEFYEYKFRHICSQCHRTFFVWSRKKLSEQFFCEVCKKQSEMTT